MFSQNYSGKTVLKSLLFLLVGLALFPAVGTAQDVSSKPLGLAGLHTQIQTIAVEAHGEVSVACSLPGSDIRCDINPRTHSPMLSVFKLPLALAVLHRVEEGAISLDQPVRFRAEDRIVPRAYSPLQDWYPNAGVDVPLRELLRLTVSLSDNVAADILLRVVGGPKMVNSYIAALGITGFYLQDNEAKLHREASSLYRNWFEPAGAVQLLRKLSDGRRLAIAVFVTDSKADQGTRETVIARIARAAYDSGIRDTSSIR
jgi:beta-lactamase class A